MLLLHILAKKLAIMHVALEIDLQKNIFIKQKIHQNLSDGFHYDPYGIRTRVTAVKGRCLNRLTNGPKIYW